MMNNYTWEEIAGLWQSRWELAHRNEQFMDAVIQKWEPLLAEAHTLLAVFATLDVVPNTSGDFACPFCDLCGVLYIPTVENFPHTHDPECPIVKARAHLAKYPTDETAPRTR